jgi:hypothetical protein
MTTAENDIDALESDLNTATTGLKARMTTAESDINTLKGKDTIVIPYDGQNSNYTNDEPNLTSPSI